MELSGTHVMAERLSGLERTVEQLHARLARLQQERGVRRCAGILHGIKQTVQWRWFSVRHRWPEPGRPVRENKRLVTHD